MRLLTVLLTLTISFLNCKGQTPTKSNNKKFVFSQVGWKIEVPASFTILNVAQVNAITNKGTNAIEKTYDTTLNFKKSKTLISITKGQYNSFTSMITPYDPKQDGDWIEVNTTMKNMIVETFHAQAPTMKIDTSSSNANIDGLEFQEFHVVSSYPNKMVMNTFIYNRLYKGFFFGITISYTDDKIGKELMAILRTSRFDK